MDVGAEHFQSRDPSHLRVEEKFVKGVVVFEPVGDGPPKLELGELYVPEKELQTCHNCKKPGHLRANCPQPDTKLICRFCNERGHVKASCPSFTCDNCGQQGHLRKDCHLPKSTQKRKRKCLNCDQSGHDVAECSQPCANCQSPHHTLDRCAKGPDGFVAKVPSTTKAEKTAKKTAEKTAEERPTQEGRDSGDVEPEDIIVDEKANQLSLPTECGLSAELVVHVCPQHITSCSVRLQAAFPSPNCPDKLEHKSTIVRFTHANIDNCDITIEPVDRTSPTAQRLLAPETLAQFDLLVPPGNADTLPLHHIRFRFNGYALLGESFYANADFGPFTEVMHQARDMMQAKAQVDVHFFLVGVGWIDQHITEASFSMREQAKVYPILDWYVGRRLTMQKGMELPPERRPRYSIPARYQFDDNTEYLTIQFYAAIAQLEASTDNVRVKTTIRLVKFPPGGDRAFLAFLSAGLDLKLRPDATVSVTFLGEDADKAKDFTMRIIQPPPFCSSYDHAGFLYRPRSGSGFLQVPVFLSEHVLDSRDYSNVHDLAVAVFQSKGIECHARECVPTKSTNREINNLRELETHRDAYKTELALFRSNNIAALPEDDFFATDITAFGSQRVNAARQHIEAILDDEQKMGFQALEKTTAGVLLVQGVGGTGKSTLLRAIPRYHYLLTAEGKGEPGAFWVMSPINKQLDDLARKLHEDLLVEYERKRELGLSPRYPVVYRRHMRSTEKKLYMQRAEDERVKRGVARPPAYVEQMEDGSQQEGDGSQQKEDGSQQEEDGSQQEEDGSQQEEDGSEQEEDLLILGMAGKVFKIYADNRSTNFDSRLQDVNLAESTWALRLAGVPDRNGVVHEIAEPDTYAEFRGRFQRLCMGEVTSPHDKMLLTLSYNHVVDGLAKKADAICMTPDAASQARNYNLGQIPRAVLHDEAARIPEPGALAGFVWSRVQQEGEDQHRARVRVPNLMFGDTLQPQGHVSPDSDLTFHPQRTVSMFARLLRAGVRAVWFWKQHRYVEPIADLVNHVLPHGRIRTSPEVADRPSAKKAATLMQGLFKVSKPLVFLATKSQSEVVPATQSKYNKRHAERVIWVVLALLQRDVVGEDIGIGVFYTSQARIFIAALDALVAWLLTQSEEWSRFAESARRVSVFTIDGIQGREVPWLILDTVIACQLGFLRDPSRIHLAVSRPRDGLIVVGNPIAVEGHYEGKDKSRYHASAFYKMLQFFKDNRLFINLERQSHNIGNAPITIREALDRTVLPREIDDEPYSYSLDDDVVIDGPTFTRPEDDEDGGSSDGDSRGGDSEGGGWGGGGCGGGGWGGGDGEGGDGGDGGGRNHGGSGWVGGGW